MEWLRWARLPNSHVAQRSSGRSALSASIMLLIAACAGSVSRLDDGNGIVPLNIVAERTPPSATGDPLSDIQQDAERHLSTFCAQLWGRDNVWLPRKKQWVYYTENWTSRAQMDFEAGELRAQILIEPGAETAAALSRLRALGDQALRATPADMARYDSTMSYVRRLATLRGVTIEPISDDLASSAVEPMLAGIINPDSAEQLRQEIPTQTAVIGTGGKRGTILTYRIPFTPKYQAKLAARYANLVRQQAESVWHQDFPHLCGDRDGKRLQSKSDIHCARIWFNADRAG